MTEKELLDNALKRILYGMEKGDIRDIQVSLMQAKNAGLKNFNRDLENFLLKLNEERKVILKLLPEEILKISKLIL